VIEGTATELSANQHLLESSYLGGSELDELSSPAASPLPKP
jgi:hypothetical protein